MENGNLEIEEQELAAGVWTDVMVREPGDGKWGKARQISSFQDLRVWKYGRALRKELTKLARALPQEEKFRLTDQIIRAARSVTNNIAEGYGQFTYKDNIHFCRQSRGSLYELIDHLIICLDEGYITEAIFEQYRNQCESAIKQLNGYIRFLRSKPPSPSSNQ